MKKAERPKQKKGGKRWAAKKRDRHEEKESGDEAGSEEESPQVQVLRPRLREPDPRVPKEKGPSGSTQKARRT